MIRRISQPLLALTLTLMAAAGLHGLIGLRPLRVVTGVAVAAAIIALVVTRTQVAARLRYALAALGAGLALSWMLTGFSAAAATPALTLALCAAVAYLASCAAKTRGADAVLDALILIAAGVGAVGLAAITFHLSRGAFLATSWRLTGTFGYQNAAAALFVLALPAALVRGGSRTAPRVATVVLAVSLAATQSRGGVLALIFALAVLRIRWRPAAFARLTACSALGFASLLPAISGASWGWATALPGMAVALSIAALPRRITPAISLPVRRALAAASVVAVAALAIAFTPASQRFATTSNDRVRVWDAAVATIAHHPLTGTGPGTFHLSTYAGDRAIVTSRAHNEYLQTIAETGLVGFVFVLAAIALILTSLRRAAPSAAVAAALAAGTGFLVHSAVEPLWRIPALPAFAFALVAATLYAPPAVPPAVPPAFRSESVSGSV